MTYNPGQVLTAAELNASIAALVPSNAANITGGYAEGLDHVFVTGTAQSTSVGTGAVVVAGGVGIGLNLQVGGAVGVAGSLSVALASDSTSTSTGAVVVAGGVGIGKSLNVGGTVSAVGNMAANGQLLAESTADATNTATGSLVVSGGVGIAKSLFVGGGVNIAGTLTQVGSLSLTNATDSTSPSTGALVITGGAGIGLNLQVGQKVTSQTAAVTAATASTSSTTGALVVTGGVGVGGEINVAGQVTAPNFVANNAADPSTFAGQVQANSTTASTSAGTGSLVVAGGVGIAGDTNASGALNVAGEVDVSNTTASTSSTTGALVVAGGVGVGGALNVSGAAAIGGNATISGLIGAKSHSNLLYNSTGELGNLGWTGSTFSGQNDLTGAGGAMFANTAALSAAASDVSQNIPVGPSVVMSLTGDLLTSGVTGGNLSLTLTAFNSSGVSLGSVCSLTLANGSAFTRLSSSGTTPAATAYVTLTKAISGSVTVSALGAGFKRIKVENSAFATIYSQEASLAASSGLSSVNPTIATGPLTFADGSQTYTAPSGKNRIINGLCEVAQRATATISSLRTYAGPDRFFGGVNSAGGAFSQSQSSILWNGVAYSAIRQTTVTAVTNLSSSNNWTGISQSIEGYNCYDMLGQLISVSFVFEASLSGLYAVSLQDSTGAYSIVGVINAVANTPQLVKMEWPAIPSAASLPQTSGTGLTLRIGTLNNGSLATSTYNTWQNAGVQAIAAGSGAAWGSTVGAFISATLVQVETGPVCTPFEHEDVTATITRCYRYFQSSVQLAGTLFNATNAGITGAFVVPMRTVPSLSGAIGLNIIGVGTPTAPGLVTSSATTLNAYQQIDWSSAAGAAVGMTLLGTCSATAEL